MSLAKGSSTSLVLIASFACGCGADDPQGPSGPGWVADAKDPEPGRLYITLTSHNEETIDGMLANADYTVEEEYLDARPLLVDMVNAVLDLDDSTVDTPAAYNWQTDWRFMEGAVTGWDSQDWEVPDGSTNSKNIVDWMEDLGVEVNPHHHESSTSGYDYGDVAYLIKAADTAITNGGNVVGGFAWGDSEWLDYPNGLDAAHTTFPLNWKWEPNIMWGASEDGSHGTTLYASGVWNPTGNADATEFQTHDSGHDYLTFLPGGCAAVIGPEPANGYLRGQSILALVDRIERTYDQVGEDELWTQRIMMNQRDFDATGEEDQIAYVKDVIEAIYADTELAAALGDGTLVWATPSDIAYAWATDYGFGDEAHGQTAQDGNGDLDCSL